MKHAHDVEDIARLYLIAAFELFLDYTFSVAVSLYSALCLFPFRATQCTHVLYDLPG